MRTTPLALCGLLCAAACSPVDAVESARLPGLLMVATADGPRHVADLGAARTLVLPLNSRSERVPLAEVRRGAVELWLTQTDGAAPVVSWIAHADDERVVVTQDGLFLLGPAQLPAALEGLDLARIARQDGLTDHSEGPVHVARGDAEGWLVALFEGDAEVQVDGATHAVQGGALCLPAAGASCKLSAPGAAFDQLAFRRCAALDASAAAPLEVQALDPLTAGPVRTGLLGRVVDAVAADAPEARGELLRFRVAAPPANDVGRSWTMLIEAPGGDPARGHADEAAAPIEPLFVDIAPQLGVDFVHLEGPDLQLDIRPTMGPGAAWGDVNGDGRPDLYLVQGGSRPGAPRLPNRLYLATPEGGFEPAPLETGAPHEGAGMGALLFDADGDADLDLYLANYGQDAVYLNDGSGRFRLAEGALPPLDLWSAGVSAADYDGDGDLDVYVTSYLDYDPAKMPPAEELDTYDRDDPIEMLPFAFPGQRNVLLRNDSGADGLAFTDVTEELGLSNPKGLGMQALWWDFDRDGDPDLYVANDVSPNVLFRNDGDGTFTDISFAVGLDDPRGGMGLDAGDVDGDGDEDIVLTNWELETNALYLNNAVRSGGKTRHARFHDGTIAAGLGPSGIGVTSWGAALFDLELDGDLDLFIANGYTSPDYSSTGVCVGQPNQLFLGSGEGRFTEASARGGAALAARWASRGTVACDFDRDGDPDLVVTANNGPVQLLRNDAPRAAGARWVGIGLRQPGGNPFAVGAEVTVTSGERAQLATIRAGQGYLTCAAPEALIGLGAVEGPARATVRWPDGETSQFELQLDAWQVLERP